MATYSIEKLSGSTDGKGIKVTGITAITSVDIHTAVATANDIDLLTLWAQNNDADAEARTLTLGWGGETVVDNEIVTPISNKAGLVLVCNRLPLMNGLVITAWADEADDVVIYGYVERVDK